MDGVVGFHSSVVSEKFDVEAGIAKCRSFDSLWPEFRPDVAQDDHCIFIANFRDRILAELGWGTRILIPAYQAVGGDGELRLPRLRGFEGVIDAGDIFAASGIQPLIQSAGAGVSHRSAMPSCQVARPQRTPLKRAPLSATSSCRPQETARC